MFRHVYVVPLPPYGVNARVQWSDVLQLARQVFNQAVFNMDAGWVYGFSRTLGIVCSLGVVRFTGSLLWACASFESSVVPIEKNHILPGFHESNPHKCRFIFLTRLYVYKLTYYPSTTKSGFLSISKKIFCPVSFIFLWALWFKCARAILIHEPVHPTRAIGRPEFGQQTVGDCSDSV